MSPERLGQTPQEFAFTANDDYLLGDAAVRSRIRSLCASWPSTRAIHRFDVEQVEARVTIPDAQLAANGIELATAGPASIRTVIQLTGEVQLDRDRTAHGAASRWCRRRGACERRRPVKAGQLLAVLSSPTLAARRSELLETEEHRLCASHLRA